MENRFSCMECNKGFEKSELIWVNDLYGIPFKNVCENCLPKVEKAISRNHYGKHLTHDELYGEDY